MKFTGAQIRLTYEAIEKGHWTAKEEYWTQDTPSQRNALSNKADTLGSRDDYRNVRAWVRRFVDEQIEVTHWGKIDRLVAQECVTTDVPDPIYVVITGNPLDGFILFGPFDSFGAAARFGDGLDDEYWVANVARPHE